ncbi:LysR substrate-binding domain-containing protein [Jatrophihabitans sp. YIM 134969]
MAEVLDIVALRSLTSIADSGGFRRAAETLHLSQSAVSQHVRRLEHASGGALVERNGRGVRFTERGFVLVADARRILAAHDDALERARGCDAAVDRFVIGSTEHGADLLLPSVTARVTERYPDAVVRFRIDRGRVLRDRLADGGVDAALLLGEPDDERAQPAGELPLGWYAAPGWRRPAGSLPLVAIDGPCTIRRRAVEILETHGIPAAVVCEAGHLAGVVSAARAGVGVALLAHFGEPPAGLERRDDLPALTPERLHVRSRTGAPPQLGLAVAAAARSVLTAA